MTIVCLLLCLLGACFVDSLLKWIILFCALQMCSMPFIQDYFENQGENKSEEERLQKKKKLSKNRAKVHLTHWEKVGVMRRNIKEFGEFKWEDEKEFES